MRLKRTVIGFILILSTFLAGCNNQETSKVNSKPVAEQNEVSKLKIYTTLFPLGDFTKKIGGEHVVVESIIPAGSNAHTYEPTSKQMVNIAEADAFIYNGLGMESYAEKISKALRNENAIMVEATHGVDTIKHSHDEDEHHDEEKQAHEDEHHGEEEHGHEDEHHGEEEQAHEGEHHGEEELGHKDEHGHHHGDFDPHVWLDPYRSITIAENIKNTLIELLPEAKSEFESNFETLKEELEALDEEFHELVKSKKAPEMIVSHAAYGYWEENYGIHQIPVSGLSPTNEPSQKELEEIINIAKEKQIKYVIFEQNVTPKVAEVIRIEINAEPLRLHNLSVLTEEDISNNEDYFSLMRKNIEVLDQAFN